MLMTVNARRRNRCGGTSGSGRTTMRIGNRIAAARPTPRATRLAVSLHPVSCPRTMPNARPPTASAMTIDPIQSSRRGAFGSRDSGTWRHAA